MCGQNIYRYVAADARNRVGDDHAHLARDAQRHRDIERALVARSEREQRWGSKDAADFQRDCSRVISYRLGILI